MTETLAPASEPLAATPLQGLHRARGAHMVAFEGYEVPAHYGAGGVAEHNHTRQHASLFDISYLGHTIDTGSLHQRNTAYFRKKWDDVFP